MSTRSRRIRHPARLVAGAAVVALVVVAVLLATRPPYEASPVDSPLAGRPAPSISGTELSGGHHLTLRQYRGHWVFVNFFASWCTPCQNEEPNLVQFFYEQQQQRDGAQLLSVVFEDTDAAAAAFDRSQGATWPVISDPGGVTANAYGVTSPPTTFLVDPSGRVVGEVVGPATVAQLDSSLASARSQEGSDDA